MICIPLRSKSFSKILSNLSQAQKIGDIVELWLEEILNLTSDKIEQLFQYKKRPFLLKFQGNLELLSRLNGYEFEYIDVDLSTHQRIFTGIRKLFPTTQIIISHHDFEGTPSLKTLKSIFNKMNKKGGDIKKIATHAQSIADSLLLLSLAKDYSDNGEKVIFIGMGKYGHITRTTGHLCGNYLSYCPLSQKQKTAPGQITAGEFKKIKDLTL